MKNNDISVQDALFPAKLIDFMLCGLIVNCQEVALLKSGLEKWIRPRMIIKPLSRKCLLLLPLITLLNQVENEVGRSTNWYKIIET